MSTSDYTVAETGGSRLFCAGHHLMQIKEAIRHDTYKGIAPDILDWLVSTKTKQGGLNKSVDISYIAFYLLQKR